MDTSSRQMIYRDHYPLFVLLIVIVVLYVQFWTLLLTEYDLQSIAYYLYLNVIMLYMDFKADPFVSCCCIWLILVSAVTDKKYQ